MDFFLHIRLLMLGRGDYIERGSGYLEISLALSYSSKSEKIRLLTKCTFNQKTIQFCNCFAS